MSVRGLSMVALCAVLATVAASWRLMERSRLDERWVAHTEGVVRHLDALLADVLDGETAERGFVISGQPSFLEPYQSARGRFEHDLAELRKLTRDNLAQQRRLDHAERVGRAELAAFDRVITLRRDDVPAAMAAIAAGGDKQLTDEVRRVQGEMKRDELALLAERQKLAAASSRNAVLIVVGAYATLLLVLAATAWALQQGRARRERDDFRERYLAIIGHDLRTPLTAISVEAQLLHDQDTAQERAATGQRIVASTDRMTRMVAQLLDATRSRLGGGMPIRRRDGDLVQLVQRGLAELAPIARGRLVTRLPEGALHVAVDEDRLMQVISNLVGNALTHGQGEVTVTLEPAQGSVLLTVHNLGTPIASDVLPRLREPFRRGSADAAGLGLGLFISDQIVRGHGGTLELTSSAQRGTEARVRLPR